MRHHSTTQRAKYYADKDGCVYTYRAGKYHKLKTNMSGNYHRVRLGGKPRMVSHVILETFVGPRPEGMEASHLDGNTDNNRLDNLVWESRSDNLLRKREHGTDHGGARNPSAVLTQEQVDEIRASHQPRKVTYQMLAEKFGVSRHTIANIIQGHTWQSLD